MHKWIEGRKGLGIIKLSPKDMFMHAERNMSTTAGIKRQIRPQRQAVQHVTQWHTYQIGVVDFHVLWPPRHEIRRALPFGLSGHFGRFPHIVPPTPPPPLLSVLFPWRQRGQNKTSKQLQNSPDTNSFPHVTWRGLAGLLDCSDWYVSASYPALPHNKQRWRDAILTERLWTVWHWLKRSQMEGVGGEFTRAYLWVMLGSDEMRKWELI